jgi:hypothetical protein
MTAPERWETTVEDDGGHDLALSGLASTAGKRASRARAGTRPDQSHDHTTDRSAALIWAALPGVLSTLTDACALAGQKYS